jgi:tetratricopeptide (TPR) repeat protein
LNLASAYTSAGEDDLALPLMEQAYELYKAKGVDHSGALASMANLGQIYSRMGQLDRALELTQQAADRTAQRFGPTHFDTLVATSGLAWVHLQRNRPDLAIELLRTVVSEQEKSLPVGHYLTLQNMTHLGIAYEAVKDYVNAENLYRTSFELHLKHLGAEHLHTRKTMEHLTRLLMNQKKYSDAESVLRKALSDYTSVEPDRWTTFLLQSGLAEAVLMPLLGQPKTDSADARLAEAESLLRSAQEGLTARAIQIPDNSRVTVMFPVHFDLGRVLRLKGKMAEAAVAYREAIRLRPDHAEAHRDLGFTLTALGQVEEAVAEYRAALQSKPDYASAHNNLAWTLATAEDPKLRQPAAAVSHAKKAVELAPNVSNYWGTLGAVHYRLGDWQAAVVALKESEELAPGGGIYSWLFLAMAHWQLGQQDEARQYYDKSVKWMTTNASDEETKRVRVEADELLGEAK